jgi:hypothetical protein
VEFTVHSKAAKVTIVALPILLAALVVLYQATRPDLTVIVDAKESTAPDDVTDWIGKGSRAIRREVDGEKADLEKVKEDLSKARERLSDLDSGLVDIQPGEREAVVERIVRLESKEREASDRIGRWNVAFPYNDGSAFSQPDTTYWQARSMAVVTLALTNESDEPINDLRVRLPGASRVWRLAAKADFLRPAELWAWQRAFDPVDTFVADSVVLPTIAQLPAGQMFTVSVWGDVASAKAEAVAASALRIETVATTRIHDQGLFAVLLHLDRWKEWWAAIFLPIIGGPLWLFAKWLWATEIAAARDQAKKEAWRENLYRIAQGFVGVAGMEEATITMLFWATRHGYTKQEIRDDETFKALWAVPLFREAFGEPAAGESPGPAPIGESPT